MISQTDMYFYARSYLKVCYHLMHLAYAFYMVHAVQIISMTLILFFTSDVLTGTFQPFRNCGRFTNFAPIRLAISETVSFLHAKAGLKIDRE